jgi:5-deoxy-5-amino-3-dehydroquinate synthase
MRVVTIRTVGGEYEVHIGPGVRRSTRTLLPAGARRAAVVTQEGIGIDLDIDLESRTFLLPQGEAAKSMVCVEELCSGFAEWGLGRSDVVVAVGGGVVSDVAGFAAAVYMRGVAYLNVATTLLAQVDAAIGGKTGVNLAEGKNLVGAFWQPTAVVCDTDALSTLPPRAWTSGRGEVAKCVFLGGLLGLSRDELADYERSWLTGLSVEEQIFRCVSVKAAAVSSDERESDVRALLNYGHTLAHALEGLFLVRDDADVLHHGEAVAIGLMFAARLAHRLGRIDAERVEFHREVLEHFALASEIPSGLRAAELVSFMRRDKKARHDLTFVLDGPRGVELVRAVPESEVLATLADMGCSR